MVQHYQDNLGGWHELDDVSFEYQLTQINPTLTFIKKTKAQFDAAHSSSLMQVQTSSYAAIDAQAGLTRTKYITNAPGQDATYQSKAADAAAYIAAGYPIANIVNYPWVQAEAKAINGATPTTAQYKAAADGIIATQSQWAILGASIEQQRRAGKIAVTNATTATAAQSACDAAILALKAL